jgi:hypothetical protein
MSFVLQPWQLLLMTLAGLVNQQQQQIIEFQRTEIQCREWLGGVLRYYNREAA